MNDVRIIANVILVVIALLDGLAVKAFHLSNSWFFIPCGFLALVVGLFCFIITILNDNY